MINLKIDPEFQNQIPPLTDDEYKQLEENILKEGKLLSPLIVWNNTLVDGHNRYAILQKHPEICFSTMPLRFESREEVLAWICKNSWGGATSPRSRSCSSSGGNMKRKNPLMAKPAKNRMMKMADFTGVLKLITPVKP